MDDSSIYLLISLAANNGAPQISAVYAASKSNFFGVTIALK
jgi:hypothetical protein